MAATLGGRIWVAGIMGSCRAPVSDPGSTVERLDPATSQWTEDTVVRVLGREGGALLATGGGQLLLLGGINDASTNALSSTHWTSGAAGFVGLASMADRRAYFAATLLPDGRVFVAGGHGTDPATVVSAVSGTELFTLPRPGLDAGQWSAGPRLGTYRAGATALASRDGRVWVLGGVLQLAAQPPAPSASVELFPADGGGPTAQAPLPMPRAFHAAAVGPDGRFYLAGGVGDAGLTGSVHALDPAHGRWVRMPDLPAPRRDLALVQGPDGRLWAIGGRDDAGAGQATVWAYGPRLFVVPAAARAGEQVVVYGDGFPGSTALEVRLGGALLASGVSTAQGYLPNSGTGALRITVPDAGEGPAVIEATDVKSRFPTRATLTVMP